MIISENIQKKTRGGVCNFIENDLDHASFWNFRNTYFHPFHATGLTLYPTAFELSKGYFYFHKIKNGTEAYSEHCQTSHKMVFFAKILNSSQLLFTQLTAMPQKKKAKKNNNNNNNSKNKSKTKKKLSNYQIKWTIAKLKNIVMLSFPLKLNVLLNRVVNLTLFFYWAKFHCFLYPGVSWLVNLKSRLLAF